MKIDFTYVINLATDSARIYDNLEQLNFKDPVPWYEWLGFS